MWRGGSRTEEEKELAWSAVDQNSDGHLNYLEFCAGFQVVDTSTASQHAVDEFSSSVLAVLALNKITLKYAFKQAPAPHSPALRRACRPG